MSDQNPLLPAIAPASGGALTTATGQQRIAARMAENLLDVARSQERALAAQRRYRIGDYEFREADHSQIQRWARMLGMEPKKVVEALASSQKKNSNNVIEADFRVADGAIVSLVWDFELLPLTDWAWGRGLQIWRLGILNAPQGSLPTLPEYLRNLFCDDNRLTSLTLAQVPQLEILDCRVNELTELDLTHVLGLKKLWCNTNQLTELDLTHVPGLKELWCNTNQLTKLDLMPVPGLKVLNCSSNPLTALDLTPVPGLQTLLCLKNQLTELNLTTVPGLKNLVCPINQLTELDLTSVPRLQALFCGHNRLTELDLTPVPGLKRLWCDSTLHIIGAPLNLKVNDE